MEEEVVIVVGMGEVVVLEDRCNRQGEHRHHKHRHCHNDVNVRDRVLQFMKKRCAAIAVVMVQGTKGVKATER